MSDFLVVGRAWHHKHELTRLTEEGRFYVLTECGTAELHAEPVIDVPVLYLEGDDEVVADWLTQMRDHYAELGRHTGWQLVLHFEADTARQNVTYMVAWWEDHVEHEAQVLARAVRNEHPPTPADFIGPLPKIGRLFKQARESFKEDYKLSFQHALVQRLSEDMKAAIDSDVFQSLLAEHSKSSP